MFAAIRLPAARRIAALILNIHRYRLELGGVDRRTADEPHFQEARAPRGDEFASLLVRRIAGVLKMLTHSGHVVEEQGMT